MDENKITILITERNPHVREFIKREIALEGYDVRVAENGREMLKWVYGNKLLDLLIFDPDLPDMDVPFVLDQIQDRVPRLPVIFHTFSSDNDPYSKYYKDAVFIEKKGSSIDELKQAIKEMLNTPGKAI